MKLTLSHLLTRRFQISRTAEPPARSPQFARLEFMMEGLEQRIMLASDFDLQAIAGLISSAANTTSGLSLSNFVRDEGAALNQYVDLALPVVDTSVGQIFGAAGDWVAATLNPALQNAASEIINIQSVDSLNNSQAESAIRNAVFNALVGTGLLQRYDVDVQSFDFEEDNPKANWIKVDVNESNIEISLSVGFVSDDILDDTSFGLGLPSLPFFFDAELNTNLDVHVGAILKQLTFSLEDGSTIVSFNDSPANNDDVTLFTQVSFGDNDAVTGSLGFLDFTAIDQGSALNLGLSFDAVGGDGIGVRSEAQLFGFADIDLELRANFAGDDGISGPSRYPAITSDFVLDWQFDQIVNLDDPLTGPGALASFGESPTAVFQDVTLDVGTYVGDFLDPFVETFQFLTAPLAPIFEALDTPLPILSQIGDLAGLDDLESLLDLVEELNDSIPTSFQPIIQLATTAINVTNFVNSIDVSQESPMISFGDFELAGGPTAAARGGSFDLRLAASANSNPLNGQPMSTLSLANSIRGGTSFADQFGKSPQAEFSFPLFEDPENGIFELLVGRDADLIRFDLFLPSSPSDLAGGFRFDVFGVVSASLNPGSISGGINLAIGFDTFGIRQIAGDLANGEEADFSKLLNGLYIEPQDGPELTIEVGAGFSAAANIPFFSGSIGGELSASFTVDIVGEAANIDQDPSKLRLPAEVGTCVFEFDGALVARLDLEFRIGVETFAGFFGVEFDETIGGTIVDFSIGGDCGDPMIPVATANGTTLTLNMDQNASSPNDKFIVDVVNFDHDDNQNTENIDVIQVVGNGRIWRSDRAASTFTNIIANAGNGDDEVLIKASVGAIDATVEGGLGNDVLTYLGSGQNTTLDGQSGHDELLGGAGLTILLGGSGRDVIKGGSGVSSIDGGNDDDQLIGGDGASFIYGGGGDDSIRAGFSVLRPVGSQLNDTQLANDGIIDVYIYGEDGEDTITTGIGEAFIDGGNQVDQINWFHGHGNATILGGSFADQVAIVASSADDDIDVRKVAVSAEPNVEFEVTIANELGRTSRILVGQSERIAIEGAAGRDVTDVWELYGTSVLTMVVNLGDAWDNTVPDPFGTLDELSGWVGAGDTTNVHGVDSSFDDRLETQGPRWDDVTILTDEAAREEGCFINPGRSHAIHEECRDLIDGTTSVRMRDMRYLFEEITEVDRYEVLISNQTPLTENGVVSHQQPQDTINVNLYDGFLGANPDLELYGETATIYSVPGLTNVNMGSGNDLMHVLLTERQETAFTGGFVIESTGYFGQLNLDGGAGVNTLKLDAGFDSMFRATAPTTRADMTLTGDRLLAESLMPLPITFTATGGQLALVSLTAARPQSTLVVRETRRDTFTSIVTNDDDVIVSSEADYTTAGEGDLSGIEGQLFHQTEAYGVTGSSRLLINDFGASIGNRAVSLGRLSNTLGSFEAVFGFAGPSDNVAIGWAVGSGAGNISEVVLKGSNNSQLRERFGYLGPLDTKVRIEGNDGPDRIDVLNNTLTEVDIYTGLGHDYVTTAGDLGVTRNKSVQVIGELTSWDQLRIDDSNGTASTVYSVQQDKVQSAYSLIDLANRVTYQHVNEVRLQATAGNDVIGVGDLQNPAAAGPPRTRIDGGEGADTMGGMNLTPNLWDVRGHNRSVLNGTILIDETENLVGGLAEDYFRMRTGGSVDGLIGGSIAIDGAVDTISYADYEDSINVNLGTLTYPGVGLYLTDIDNLVGTNQSDTLVGADTIDHVWELTGTDSGSIFLPSNGNFELAYDSFETIMTGNGNDALNFYDETRISGGIFLGANAPDTGDILDANRVTTGVIVDLPNNRVAYRLASGTQEIATTDAGYTGIIGTAYDDILLGSDQDNIIFGNDGNDVIAGNGGNDTIFGEGGLDILIGGNGADGLSGGAGDDLLIGGRVTFENSLSELQDVQAIWSNPNQRYAARVNSLRGLLEVGSTVFFDAVANFMQGDANSDWFFAATIDIISDHESGESIN